MTPERYRALVAEFDALVSHAQAVSDRLVGALIERKDSSYADAIFSKLLCHALSLRKLSPAPDLKVESELWDLSSACAIARALIESYDALAYIAVHAVSGSEPRFIFENFYGRPLVIVGRIREAAKLLIAGNDGVIGVHES